MSSSKFCMISFIVGKDQNQVDILMSVLVDPKTLEVDNIKIAGDVVSKKDFSSPIVIDKDLYEAMKNSELMDLSPKFAGKSPKEILQAIQNTLQEG